jgi:hypothetical protein
MADYERERLPGATSRPPSYRQNDAHHYLETDAVQRNTLSNVATRCYRIHWCGALPRLEVSCKILVCRWSVH